VRTQAEAELITHPSMKRFLTRRHGRLVIDRREVHVDEHLNGKFLISSSDDDLPAEQIALYYKQLIEVEACWRDTWRNLRRELERIQGRSSSVWVSAPCR
jgi:hypothetical protein